MSHGRAPRLSVVLPTRNRAPLLSGVLHGLVHQTLQPDRYEVVVVDNGSTDDTEAVVRDAAALVPNLRYVYASQPGLHVARHAGMRAAAGEIVVYGDDDISPLPTWLEAISDSFANHRVALVGGKCLPQFESSPPQWLEHLWTPIGGGKAIGAYSVLDLGDRAKEIDATLVWGCNYSIRRDSLLQAGGFNPDAMPEALLRYRGDGETGLSLKLAARGELAWYEPAASVLHLVASARMTADYIFKRAFSQGISDSYSTVRYGRSPLVRMSIARIKSALYKLRLGGARGDSPARIAERAASGYEAGLLYHRAELRRDPGLLAWIRRESYIDDATP